MDDRPPSELIDHLCRISALSKHDARRLVGEVLAFYNETSDAFIRRRHLELQGAGVANRLIYATIAQELEHRRFPSGRFTERQIRRVIYG